MGGWTGTILEILPIDGRPLSKGQLEVLCSQRLAQPLDRNAFGESLDFLQARRQIDCDSSSIWRVEPDFPEKDLEEQTAHFLTSETCRAALHISVDGYVFENTTAVGMPGAGVWSRPDFTMAAIRRFKYDPRRYLDVYSFELKNRRGTNVVAVHEALAHGRFSHFAYLVCPRFALNQAPSAIIRQACMDHGVGLVTFDIEVTEAEQPLMIDFRFEASPQRRNIDPADVDRYLEARLPARALERLSELASAP